MAGEIILDLPLLGGYDAGTENTAGVRPSEMTNCVYRKVGGVRKRFGVTRLNTNADITPQAAARKPIAGTEPTKHYPLNLFPSGNSVAMATDCSIETWSSKTAAWSKTDTIVSLPAQETRLAGLGNVGSVTVGGNPTVTAWDSAVGVSGPGSGYRVNAWVEIDSDTSGFVYRLVATVLSETSDVPIISRYLVTSSLTSGSYARVGFWNGKYLIVFHDNNLHLNHVEFDPSTLTFGAVTSYGITDQVDAFDFAVQVGGSTNYAIVYSKVFAGGFTARTFDSTHTNTHTSTASALASATNVGCFFSTNHVWSIASANAYGVTVSIWPTNLASVVENNLTATPAAPVTINGTNDSSAIVAWTTSTYTEFATINTSGVVQGSYTGNYRAYGAQLLTNLEYVSYNGNTYIMQMMLTSSYPSASQLTGDIALVWWRVPANSATVTAIKPLVLSICRTRVTALPPQTRIPAGRLTNVANNNLFAVAGSSATGVQRTTDIYEYAFTLDTSARLPGQYEQLGGVTYLPQGAARTFDGTQAADAIFYDFPQIDLVAANGGSLITATSYGFAAIWVWTDAAGNVKRSAPFLTTITPTSPNLTVNATVYTPQLTDAAWGVRPAFVEVYMTASAGTTYLLAATAEVTPATGASVAFSFTSAPSASARRLYTDGGTLDNVCSTGGTCITLHQSRIWLGGTPDDTLWVSKEYVLGEAPGFSEGFSIQPFGGGRVVALQTQDQFLIVFKESAIYAISGQGADDNGNGGTYSLPTFVTSETGCVDKNSVALIPQGTLFRGARGMYLLDKSMNCQYVGRAVEAFLTPGITITNAVVYAVDSQVWFFTSGASVLVFDYLNMSWSFFNFLDENADLISFRVGCVNGNVLYMVDTAMNLYKYDTSTYYDCLATPVPMSLTTSFTRPPDSVVEGWHRVKSIALKLEKLSDTDITIGVAHDYDPTPSETRSWTSADTAAWIGGSYRRQAAIHPAVQKTQAIAVSYSDTGSFTGNGGGFALQAISVEYKPKAGLTRINPGQVK